MSWARAAFKDPTARFRNSGKHDGCYRYVVVLCTESASPLLMSREASREFLQSHLDNWSEDASSATFSDSRGQRAWAHRCSANATTVSGLLNQL